MGAATAGLPGRHGFREALRIGTLPGEGSGRIVGFASKASNTLRKAAFRRDEGGASPAAGCPAGARVQPAGPQAQEVACAGCGLLKQRAAMHEGSITIRIPADVKDIERLCHLVRQFGELHDIPSRTLYAVNLAMDEAVTNAGALRLRRCDRADADRAFGRVGFGTTRGDRGRRPRLQSAGSCRRRISGAPLEARELGGLGIHLVRSLMDRLSYRRDGAKNVLTMTKRIR